MPFDEEEDNDQPSARSLKVGLKKVSTRKSIFEDMPKKPTQEDLDKKVKNIVEKNITYKQKASELAMLFGKAMVDKTLKQNKNIFNIDFEQDLLSKMINLGIEINNDEAEMADMGSMSWITLLLKTCFAQRDRINLLEYTLSQLEKKMEVAISKEIQRVLDSKKASE
jgi:hypothetical protein